MSWSDAPLEPFRFSAAKSGEGGKKVMSSGRSLYWNIQDPPRVLGVQ